MNTRITETQIVEAIRRLCPNVTAIYAFGSWSSPQEHRESDIDLAILDTQAISPQGQWERTQHLSALLEREVDWVDLLSASTVMRMQIVGRGRRLYCLDERQTSLFEDYVFSSYARLNEERKEILSDAAKRGCVYGG
jgi:predicted nucleotidyltransferase